MKKTVLSATIITSSIVVGIAGAASVEGLSAFTAGTAISSAAMNANFDAVKTAVDANDAAITEISGKVTALEQGSVAAACGEGMETFEKLGLCVDKAEGIIAGTEACTDLGADCSGVTYSISAEGDGRGSSNVSWFQAVAACQSVDKRLPTNYEWTLFASQLNNGLAGVTDGQSTLGSGSNAEWVQDWAASDIANGTGDVAAMNRGFQGNIATALLDTAPNFVVDDLAYGFRCVKDI